MNVGFHPLFETPCQPLVLTHAAAASRTQRVISPIPSFSVFVKSVRSREVTWFLVCLRCERKMVDSVDLDMNRGGEKNRCDFPRLCLPGVVVSPRGGGRFQDRFFFPHPKHVLRGPPLRSLWRDVVAVQLFLQNGVHKQNGGGQWAACSEVEAIMRADVWLLGDHSRWGETHPCFCWWASLSLSLFSLLFCLSWPLALFSSLANMHT